MDVRVVLSWWSAYCMVGVLLGTVEALLIGEVNPEEVFFVILFWPAWLVYMSVMWMMNTASRIRKERAMPPRYSCEGRVVESVKEKVDAVDPEHWGSE